jgi:hypothetical protein
MASSLSKDLRSGVILAVEEERMSRRGAAARFVISDRRSLAHRAATATARGTWRLGGDLRTLAVVQAKMDDAEKRLVMRRNGTART